MTKSTPKSTEIFKCTKCNFITSRLSHWNRHVLTAKHKMDNADNKMDNEKSTESPLHECICGKKYKFKSGLCKHKKKCLFGGIINTKICEPTSIKKNKKVSLEVENAELKDELGKLKSALPTLMDNITEILKTQKELTQRQEKAFSNPQTNNYINNRLSINVYLNENCKDAMNLQDFIDSLKVSLEDLNYTKNHGYAKGLSNIFVKQLKDLEPTQRPIHCSDNKRLKFYVKDDNKWEKDNKNEKIDKTIDDLAKKQLDAIKQWEKNHPRYEESETLLMEWHSMVKEVVGGIDKNNKQKNSEIIKKEIGATVKLTTDLLNK